MDARRSALLTAVLAGPACAQLLGVDEVSLEGPPMLSVPASDFTMGCGDVTASCEGDEMPTHEVTVSAFEIDETEVTRGDYQRCVDAAECLPATCPGNQPDAGEPATCVTWDQARVYCARLGKRLPTEAEWEKTARGSSDGRPWPWGTDDPTCMHANLYGCAGGLEAVGSHPVGRSPYGPLDLAGNASEWVADAYQSDYYAMSPALDPQGPASGTSRVYRGGSFSSGPGGIRVSARDGASPDGGNPERGFRCAR